MSSETGALCPHRTGEGASLAFLRFVNAIPIDEPPAPLAISRGPSQSSGTGLLEPVPINGTGDEGKQGRQDADPDDVAVLTQPCSAIESSIKYCFRQPDLLKVGDFVPPNTADPVSG